MVPGRVLARSCMNELLARSTGTRAQACLCQIHSSTCELWRRAQLASSRRTWNLVVAFHVQGQRAHQPETQGNGPAWTR